MMFDDEQELRDFEATAAESLRLMKLGMRAIRDADGAEEAKGVVLSKLREDTNRLRMIVKSVQMAQIAVRELEAEDALDDEDDFRLDVLDDLKDLPTTED